MSYVTLLIFYEVTVGTTLFGGVMAALACVGWARRPTALKRRTLLLAIGLATSLVAMAAMQFFLWRLSRYGPEFVKGHVLYMVPLQLLPLIASGVFSVPRLRGLTRLGPKELPAKLFATSLQLPLRALALGAFLDFCLEFSVKPVPPYGHSFSVAMVIFAIGLALVYGWLRYTQGILKHQNTGQLPRWRWPWVVSAAAIVLLIGAGLIVYELRASRLPANYSMLNTMMDHGRIDYGRGSPLTMPAALNGPVSHMAMPMHGMSMTQSSSPAVSVSSLTGDTSGTPDVRYTLTAREQHMTLPSGKKVTAWAYNNQAPGPLLIMHDGDLVEVTLINQLPPGNGVTLHWHGLDVPNAEDGVAGITQDAVEPGQQFVYRFRVHQVGTFWYHSHQDSFHQVPKGLFGPLVVLPKGEPMSASDVIVAAHLWPGESGNALTLNTDDASQSSQVAQGTAMRLRLINTSSKPIAFGLNGAPFKVVAIDGTDLNRPSMLQGQRLVLAAGGRYDITFTMPARAVALDSWQVNDQGGDAAIGKRVRMVFRTQSGQQAPSVDQSATIFDAATYGRPAATPFGNQSHFDRQFRLTLDDRFGFSDGKLFFMPTINGAVMPNTPMLMVRQGDLVKMTITARGHVAHPMHLHGHHALVLTHNGRAVRGSPWWVDSLYVAPGDTYEIAFRADNPGIWMDHCHNLEHAAQGMVMHLAYENVATPFRLGSATINKPE